MAEQTEDMCDFLNCHHFNVHSPESGYAKVVTAKLRQPEGKTILRGYVITNTLGKSLTTHTSASLREWLICWLTNSG